MEHLKRVTIPAREESTTEVTDYVSCDFCGTPIQKSRGDSVETVTLQMEDGWRAVEGGDGTATIFDCCKNCWSNKVAPALQALTVDGRQPRTEDWDY